MNKQIAELKTQCIVREQRGTSAFDSYMVDRVDTEKFAELIVQECKAVMLVMMNNKQGDFNTLDLALTEINEHFGIKDDYK